MDTSLNHLSHQVRQQLQLQQSLYQRLLQEFINQNQSLKVILSYCQQVYNNTPSNQPIISTFDEYSPKEISKFLLKPQLTLIQGHFGKFPNKKCNLEHFLLILITVMAIPFEEIPKYLIGLMEIFKLITQNNRTVTWDDFFQYIVGQVPCFQEQQQNTQFQIHFQQLKKQDYLSHDSGIRRIHFVKDLRVYIVLDQNAQVIKIYNTEMKIITRFQPSKQKHGSRSPKMTYFDYNQFNNKLGIAYSDCTIELINLQNFLNRRREEFQKLCLSYEIWQVDQVVVRLEFLQMSNKWLALLQSNKLLLYHFQKPKESTQQLMKQIILWTDPKQQLRITDILQVVPLATICIVAGNQLFFFNQKLSQNKYKNYKHGNNIQTVKFCQQKNSFYLLTQDKFLTILTVERNSHLFKLSTYPLNHIVKDFEIFSHFQTIILTDNQHKIWLYDLKNLFCYQSGAYAHIAKKPNKYIGIFKTSKSQFIIHQTYMLSMNTEKVALQKQVQYSIDPEVHYDQQKQQIYMSINRQIINFNLLRRQIIKIYNQQNHSLPRDFSNYMIDENNHIMTLDSTMKLAYLKKREKNVVVKQTGSKQFDVDVIKLVKYNQQRRMVYLLGKSQLYQVKVMKDNLQTARHLIFQNVDQITSQSYSLNSHQLLLSTDNSLFYLISLENFTVEKKLHLIFPRDKSMVEEVKCTKSHYLSQYNAVILLTNNNHLYIVSLRDPNQHYCLKLLEGVTYRQVDVDFRFGKMVVAEIKQKYKENFNQKQPNIDQVVVMLTTIQGHFMRINLTQYLLNLSRNQITQQTPTFSSYKAIQTNNNKYLINSNFIQTKQFTLKLQNHTRLMRNQCQFDKRHQKEIIVMKSIYLEKYLTLTVSKDGEIKLCEGTKTICIAKLPNISKKQWNMKDIEKIKIIKISQHIRQVLNKINQPLAVKTTPRQILNKIQQSKLNDNDFKKINHEEPFPFEFEKQTIENIVKKEIHYEDTEINRKLSKTAFSFRTHKRFSSSPILQEVNKTFTSPWRQKKSFVDLYSNLPSDHKYARKIPQELVCLRKSLDMKSKQKKVQYQKLDVKIIPQLNFYQFEDKLPPNSSQQESTSQILNQTNENFDSCYYIKSLRKMRKTNINDFDEIDKEFFKKQANTGRKYIPKKEIQKEDNYLETQPSKSLCSKRPKKSDFVQGNKVLQKSSNPITSIVQLFQKHNKEVTGSRFNRQIRISQDLKNLRNKTFDSRY